MTQQPTTVVAGRSTTKISICQQNVNKSLIAQEDLLHRLKLKKYNVAAIQEPYLHHHHNSHASLHWYTVYPKEHYIDPDKTWTIILVNKKISTDSWTDRFPLIQHYSNPDTDGDRKSPDYQQIQ